MRAQNEQINLIKNHNKKNYLAIKIKKTTTPYLRKLPTTILNVPYFLIRIKFFRSGKTF